MHVTTSLQLGHLLIFKFYVHVNLHFLEKSNAKILVSTNYIGFSQIVERLFGNFNGKYFLNLLLSFLLGELQRNQG